MAMTEMPLTNWGSTPIRCQRSSATPDALFGLDCDSVERQVLEERRIAEHEQVEPRSTSELHRLPRRNHEKVALPDSPFVVANGHRSLALEDLPDRRARLSALRRLGCGADAVKLGA